MTILILLATMQLQLPDPVGFVNDFAGVLTTADQRGMLALIEEVRQKSGGELVVVTLPDLQGRAAIAVARDIGRQWGIGAVGQAGDRARNAGVVLLLKPGARPGDGRSDIAIGTGLGAEESGTPSGQPPFSRAASLAAWPPGSNSWQSPTRGSSISSSLAEWPSRHLSRGPADDVGFRSGS
jgi:hypothetical protein